MYGGYFAKITGLLWIHELYSHIPDLAHTTLNHPNGAIVVNILSWKGQEGGISALKCPKFLCPPNFDRLRQLERHFKLTNVTFQLVIWSVWILQMGGKGFEKSQSTVKKNIFLCKCPTCYFDIAKKKTTNSEQCENSLLGQDEEHKVQLFWEGHKNLCHPPYDFNVY